MRSAQLLVPLMLIIAGGASAHAQTGLRASPSGRGTSEVTLSYPRPPAPAGAPAPGAPAPGASSTGTPATGVPPTAVPATVVPAGSPAAAAAKPLIIRLDYGQPHLRGRTLHTDSLVPYDKPWRAGANGPTTLTTDVDLVLGGTPLAKRTYILLLLPGRAGWKLIVQKSAGQGGMTYEAANDVARIDLRRRELSSPVESLTMWLIPSLDPGTPHGELRIAWGGEDLATTWSLR
ncbi:MAG: DUF2911 domain-containing protein [Gemmatimonadaceae bacterium]